MKEENRYEQNIAWKMRTLFPGSRRRLKKMAPKSWKRKTVSDGKKWRQVKTHVKDKVHHESDLLHALASIPLVIDKEGSHLSKSQFKSADTATENARSSQRARRRY